jgi:hypothetical protein
MMDFAALRASPRPENPSRSAALPLTAGAPAAFKSGGQAHAQRAAASFPLQSHRPLNRRST